MDNEERRLVTVLFADVCGSTQLAEQRDPEDVRALLSAFIGLAREAIERHEGRLEKFIGDAVMAVFGLPSAHDDDAARAVAAGLELRDRVRAVPELAADLPIRIGVHTGEVVANRDPRAGDFLVTGDAVNAAARLEQAAGPWEVLVSDRTARATGDRFVWEERTDVEARGKRSRVSARLAIRKRTGPPRRRLPLVDRIADLQLLELTARRAFAERRPYLVTVLAPAGTGKTRLAEELIDVSLPHLAPEARVICVECLPYGETFSCSPLRSLLFGLLAADPTTEAKGLRDAACRWLAQAGHPDPDTVAALLLSSIGEGEVLSADRIAAFSAWRTALQLAADAQPLVLFADDLHASTDTFIELLQYAIAPQAAVPLLGLVLARPELVDRCPAWATGRRNSIVLSLGPLADADVATLVEACLGERDPGVIRQVVDRAAGNPFFVQELVRAVREPAAGAHSRGDNAAGLTLPDSVQATLLGRMDLLPPTARRTLQVGAVFGPRFGGDAVIALHPALAGAVPDALHALEDHDLVALEPGGEAVFRHALIQQAAYQTLTRPDRARLHADAARWMEVTQAGGAEQATEVIAYHWHQAATLMRAAAAAGPPETCAQAATWLARAAELDLRRWAAPEAATHLRQALEVAPAAELPGLHERLGDVVQAADASSAAYATALQLHREAAHGADDLLRLIGKRILVLTRTQGAIAQRPSDEAMAALVAEGAALLAQATDREAIARYLIACGFLPYWRAGGQASASPEEVAERRVGIERGLIMAAELDDVGLQSCALDALSGTAQSLGRHAEARDHARHRLELPGLDPAELLDASAFVAWESCLIGEYREAARVTEEALGRVEAHGRLIAGLHVLAWRAHALAILGEDPAALAAASTAEAVWIETGKGTASYAVHGPLAALEVCRAAGDDAGAAHWRAVIEEICAPLEPGAFGRTALHVARLDREGLLRAIAQPVALGERSHLVERALATALDHRWLPGEDALRRLLDEAERQRLDPLAVQARRGLGLLLEAPEEMRAARALAARMASRRLVSAIDAEITGLKATGGVI